MPSSYINSDSIGNSYMNRLDGAVLQGEPISYYDNTKWNELFTEKWGDNRERWTNSGSYTAIRFPVAWETLSGNIAVPSSLDNTIPANARITFNMRSPGPKVPALNSSNSTSVIVASSVAYSAGITSYTFAVLNDYALAWCAFDSTSRTSASFGYVGWLRNDSGGSGGRYTGLQFPRNLCRLYGLNLQRVTTENLTGVTTLYSTNDTTFNPAINCIGDSTPLILRDSTSPFPRVGMPYHLFRIPSSCTIGQVYKLGTDPDNSNKPYVICCGNWGSFKVGMRVWADGYT